MLTKHFSLGVEPFGVTPDARFLYLSGTHREAMASLHYGMRFGRGFTALIAAPGMGKTTLLFHLLGLLEGNAKTAFLFQTLCGPQEFLRSLLADLGIEDGDDDISRMHAKLNSYLLKESKSGRQVVVVIDEAQNLDDGVLELVRMLSNFETPSKKLMQIVLSGQPQLAEKLASEHLTQLRQRISIVARLTPFNADETREYIEHRLRVAGGASGKPLFSKQAYAMIAEQSRGIPRNINNLCFNSMSLACALKRPAVDALMVQETINDLDLTIIAPPKRGVVQRHPRPGVFDKVGVLFGPWRYGAALAIGFLIFPGLFVHRWPISSPIPQEHASNLQRRTGGDSEVGPASNVFAKQEGNEQVQQPQEKSQTDVRPVTSASHASSTIPLVPLPSYNIQTNGNQKSVGTEVLDSRAHDSLTETGTLELGPLPKDLERLPSSRIVELSPILQVRGKTRAAPEQNPVPFEPPPQRDKP
jgi:general secretion pathway protein A